MRKLMGKSSNRYDDYLHLEDEWYNVLLIDQRVLSHHHLRIPL